MSNLLDEAIIDAKALREAALKNAETIVIEKYSNEVKKTLEEVADAFSITRERIRQIEAKTLRKVTCLVKKELDLVV